MVTVIQTVTVRLVVMVETAAGGGSGAATGGDDGDQAVAGESRRSSVGCLEFMAAGGEVDTTMAEKSVDVIPSLGLNPMAEEFVPSAQSIRNIGQNQMVLNRNSFGNQIGGNYTSDRRNFHSIFLCQYRNAYSQDRRRLLRSFDDLREDRYRALRTVYISELDHKVREERLADLFSIRGQVLDCRVCGDPFSALRFAFVEFSDEGSARAALSLSGITVGSSKIRVMPSKTAIYPVNPALLPQSEEEKEKCTRTICCTNIDKQFSQADLKAFFENKCGEVSRLRLLGDRVHSTRIAFIEFVMVSN
ncbi:hypothetical protein OSB04_015528 [Centaurea solstitialis]|uniref:RRM domain-containing protein n=1 Tax=Centaurea solstitialis TaxID=347529 RepID=A0AA38TJ83_9ASTR|nr:hypothetical protein OSB04_015528 [Centaurea solstitialis]